MVYVSQENGRLDKILSDLAKLSRNQIENFIENFGVKVNNKLIFKNSYKVFSGDLIEFEPKEANTELDNLENSRIKVDFEIDILYEDDDLLVINKPPFLTVHKAPSVKEATVVDWLVQKGVLLSTISGEERRGIVHRIDKETSGALLVAKTNKAHLSLSAQLEDRSMGRLYLALIDIPLKEDIDIEKPIARSPQNRLKMASIDGGKYAKSSFYKLLSSKDQKNELILAKLSTGRTHQIRVHLATLSRHILGDDLYGFKSGLDKINRVFLHAYLIYFIHPVSGKKIWVKAPLFEDMNDFINKKFTLEDINEKIDPYNLFNICGFSI